MTEIDVLKVISDGLKEHSPGSPLKNARIEHLNVTADYQGDWDNAAGFTLHTSDGQFDVIVGRRMPESVAARGG